LGARVYHQARPPRPGPRRKPRRRPKDRAGPTAL